MTTRLAAVIGWPVEHSRSPALHGAAYRALKIDAVYLALPVRPGRVAEALRGLAAVGFLGANVTVPHKEEALAACDRVSAEARAVGAVNTVVPAGDGLAGHNTDVAGFRAALVERGPVPARAVVLGAGGAARAVLAALAALGVPAVVVARDPARAVGLGRPVVPWTAAALAGALAGDLLVVDTTSAALHAETEGAVPAPIPLEGLGPGAVVGSLIYHREPALLAAARARRLATFDGAAMLVHQAAAAFTLMTGVPAPLEVMRAAL